MKNLKRNLFSVVTVAAFLLMAIASSDNKKKDEAGAADTKAAKEQTETKAAEKAPNWSYSEDADKMSGTKRYFAVCNSTNEIEFQFPYNGGSTFALTVRNMGKGNEIILQVSKGQFIASIMSSQACRVKFDDEQPVNFSYNSAADGSSEVIFFDGADKFLAKLKTSKKLMIEAPFFDAGNQIIEFDTEGLIWDK